MLYLVRGFKQVQSLERVFEEFSDTVIESGKCDDSLTVPHPTRFQVTDLDIQSTDYQRKFILLYLLTAQ